MASAQKVDESKVSWVAPEVVAQDKRADVVRKHQGDPEELVEKLNNLGTVPGEYRVFTDEEVVEGVQGSRVEKGVVINKPGELVVWIDDAPDDPEDPAGHFEVYDPDKHGEPYAPIPSRRAGTVAPATVNPPAKED